MRRRDFVASLLVAIAARGAQAQQPGKVYRIAVVSTSTPLSDISEMGTRPSYRAFFGRLRQLGYIEGQNLSVERYSDEGRTDHFDELAARVVRSNPDLIYAAGWTVLTRALKSATSAIPIVAITGDPVASGIASSLARPGGNVTGTTVNVGMEIWGKRLELLREMVPAASRIGYLVARQLWESKYNPPKTALAEAAKAMNISLVALPLDAPFDEAEYRRVFGTMLKERLDALIVNDTAENITNRELIVNLAAEARLPAIYAYRDFTDAGGLMAYGADLRDAVRHVADQIDMIFKGAKPAEIPFYQPTKFDLAINAKTAKALGITVPPTLLIAADEVIE